VVEMASSRVTANTTAQDIVTAPKIRKGKIVSIEINNRHTAAVQVTLQDVYTPTGKTAKTVVKKTIVPIAAGASYDLIFGEKPVIEFMGTLQAVADVTTTACEIVVGYQWE